METYYIGLASTFHDPAMAVVDSKGEVIYAEATERFLQYKRAYGCAPDLRETVRQVLKKHCDPQANFVIATPWSGKMTKFLGVLDFIGETGHMRLAKRSSTMTRFLVDERFVCSSVWLQHASNKQAGGHLADILRLDHGNDRITYRKYDHHLSHAANACFGSPFEKAACMVVDGQGEWGSVSYYDYSGGKLKPVAKMKGEESLGILYGICTEFCGFNTEKGEEWKVMGLAPYGALDCEVLELLQSLVQVSGLVIKYPSLPEINDWFAKMKLKARKAGSDSMTVANLAYTTQYFYAQLMNELLTNFHALGISDNLVIGGGCGLNSSYNGQVIGSTPFKQLHVPSAPSDDGNAIGCALLAYYEDHPAAKPKGEVQSPYLGASISKTALEHLVQFSRIPKLRHLPGRVHLEAAKVLAEGKLIGWVQGRAEFGPRSLGNRSILADPRPPEMKEKINALVKFREEFRPFAPSILHEHGPEYFENYQISPYMERTLTFRKEVEEKVPAIVHVNNTGRLQSVRREWNERYYDLISAFHELTGVPMLLNTSLNIMGKPIIHSVEDALGIFYTTGLDALVLEDYLIEK